jgi:hypothetical protein
VAAIAICVLAIAGCAKEQKRVGLEAADHACSQDSDCTIVHDDCCDCADGDGPAIVNKAAAARIPPPRGCESVPCKPVVNGSPACTGVARAVCRDGLCAAVSKELP